MEKLEQNRRRMQLATVVIVVTLLGLLAWFLMHPSTGSSPARKVKNAIFGPRITEAAEQYSAEAGGAGGQGGGTPGPSSNESAPSAKADVGNASSPSGSQGTGSGKPAGHSGSGPGAPGQTQAGLQSGGADHGAAGPGQGTPLTGPVTGPANPHGPSNNPPDSAAPPARSIGWLDRFFGTQIPNEGTPIRSGEGGTSLNLPESGNTNLSVAATSAPVAAEFTSSNSTSAEVSLEEPPSPTRSTNRAPQANSALNDNFEQLLRQHRAGSGDVRISLMWSNKNDLDLHVLDPRGEEIFYGHRLGLSGGLLDIDMNASPPLRVPAVENVFWPQRAAPPGQYSVYVNHYRRHDAVDLTPFTVRVLVRGQTTDINGSIRFGEPKKMVYQFNVSRRSP